MGTNIYISSSSYQVDTNISDILFHEAAQDVAAVVAGAGIRPGLRCGGQDRLRLHGDRPAGLPGQGVLLAAIPRYRYRRFQDWSPISLPCTHKYDLDGNSNRANLILLFPS